MQVLCVWDSIARRPGTSPVLPPEVRNVWDYYNSCWNTVLYACFRFYW